MVLINEVNYPVLSRFEGCPVFPGDNVIFDGNGNEKFSGPVRLSGTGKAPRWNLAHACSLRVRERSHVLGGSVRSRKSLFIKRRSDDDDDWLCHQASL